MRSSLENSTAIDVADAPGLAPGVAEEDLLRAQAYSLLSALLLAPPKADLIDVLKHLNGDDSPFGQALSALAAQALNTDLADIEDEFTRLFYGHGAGGELHPYASFYLTGFVYDKPLALLRADLKVLGLGKTEASNEPEDHIAFIMNVMHDLIVGTHGAVQDLAAQKAFYDKHVAPWASAFFDNLQTAENAEFYRPVGAIGRLLMDIENEAFSIAA